MSPCLRQLESHVGPGRLSLPSKCRPPPAGSAESEGRRPAGLRIHAHLKAADHTRASVHSHSFSAKNGQRLAAESSTSALALVPGPQFPSAGAVSAARPPKWRAGPTSRCDQRPGKQCAAPACPYPAPPSGPSLGAHIAHQGPEGLHKLCAVKAHLEVHLAAPEPEGALGKGRDGAVQDDGQARRGEAQRGDGVVLEAREQV
mmetsp:Transcript_22288/g.75004  ORF Transcript_22288/g.75004 Transcript_22288/m.75004 type:complete len:202 (-) Transcript_22288:373-978(-)